MVASISREATRRLRSRAPTSTLDEPVREHLLLGMTFAAACRFLEDELGVLSVKNGSCARRTRMALSYVSALLACVAKSASAERLTEAQRGHWWKDGAVALAALPPEVRKDEEWLTTSFHGRLTGYHIVALVREWLDANTPTNEKLSVCEVLQRRGWEGIGSAHCFLSHAQSEHPGETLAGMQDATHQRAGAAKSAATRVWVDFFSLRQTEKGAFDPLEVVTLIARIGWGVLQIDRRWTYATRTFCILEAYATIRAGVTRGSRVQFRTPPVPTLAPHVIFCPRKVAVDAKASSTRRAEDKALIDSYVEGSIGFDLIDATMTSAIARQLTRQRVFAAVRLSVYLGLVGLFLWVVELASVPIVGHLILFVPTSWYCSITTGTVTGTASDPLAPSDDATAGEPSGELPGGDIPSKSTGGDARRRLNPECYATVDTMIVGLVSITVVGILWYLLSGLIYWRLERRPRVEWARAPLETKTKDAPGMDVVAQSV